MRASKVRLPLPLTRLPPIFPGQVGGVPGVDIDTGLRTHPTGKVLYADPAFPGVSDQRDGTNPTSPLLTIQEAVDQCRDYRGDTIVVGANSGWTYSEAGTYGAVFSEAVTLDKHGVRLVGASQGVGVPWMPATSGGIALTVTGVDCTVEGFAFMGNDGAAGGTGIYSEWDGVTLYGENLTVRHCLFDDVLDTGIQLEFSWYCEIYENFFAECDAYGIQVDVAGSGVAYCHIHHNTFHDIATGAISLLGGCDDNYVYGNHIFNGDAQNGAAATNEGINTTGGGDNMVFDNFLSCLLPVPANGDYDDFCSAAATDAWIRNHCMDGPTVTNPT